ncbi:MAG: hypothetical protein JNN20_18810 [Betaproteobacteria bacterium]|nr:hypothetical protein [Betaproteobacteria bacterium]
MSVVQADACLSMRESGGFDRQLQLRMEHDASAFAGDLFRESFGMEFPAPRPIKYGEVQTLPSDWRQAVAIYKWADGREECVGLANWIKFRSVYLIGALCVKRDFYRRLPADQYRQCSEQGGIAQIVMEFGDRMLDDADGWFGYCGDAKAFRVGTRVNFVRTQHRYIIVKWDKPLPEARKQALIDEVATIGPF